MFTSSQDDSRPILHQFQQGFNFPYFAFSSTVLHKLGLLGVDIQQYSHVHTDWVGINVDHIVKIADGEEPVLFVKATHVNTCMEFSQRLQRFFPLASFHPTSTPLDVSSDVQRDKVQASQRAGLPSMVQSGAPHLVHSSKAQGKQRARSLLDSSMLASPRCLSVISISSDHSSLHPSDDSESSSSSPAPLAHTYGKKRARTQTMSESGAKTSSTDDSSAIIVCRKRPRIQSSPPGLDPGEASTSGSFSMHSHPVNNPTEMGGVLSRGSSHDSPINVDHVRLWPVDFYVCEIAQGFKLCAQAAATHKGVRTAFARFFDIEFHSSTFYDNRRIWEHPANRELGQQLVRLGRCEAGKWVAFMAKAVRPLRK